MASTTLSAAENDGNHLGLFPRCGICADTVLRHERVITLFGNRDSTSYRGCTRPFPFPQPGHTITRVDGRLLCRYPDCRKCTASPEFVPVHFECFEVFKQRCTLSAPVALSRLWTLAAWRRPWRGAQPLHFAAQLVDKEALKEISEFSGLPSLYRLPLELLEMIRIYSQHSLLWRCIPALQLAAYVSATRSEPLLTVPLRDILYWERDGGFERIEESRREHKVIRVTIDSAGISKIERLPSSPPYTGECISRSAFIVRNEASLLGVVAQLKDRRLRLVSPAGRKLPVWNTPSPPDLSLCKAYPADLASCQALHAVDMSEVNGITFFFSRGQLFGIHAHRSEESSALDTCMRNFPNRLRRTIIWIYLPVPKRDRPLVLGVRKATGDLSILVRTERMGDIIIGPQRKGNVKDRCLAASAPVTMIYGEPREGRPVPVFGAYRMPPLDQTIPKPFRLENPGLSPINDDVVYFSWAPLDGVWSARVFYDRSTGFCRGIAFLYSNGGSRTVGQCRLHVDPAESVVQPSQLRFQTDSRAAGRNQQIYLLKVKFKQSSPVDDTHTEGWKSCPMQGIVKFWFTAESSFLIVEN